MKTSYTQNEIDSMVNDVTSQLDALLKSEGATLLKKSDDGGAPGMEGDPTIKAAPDASAPPPEASASPAPEASGSPGDTSLPDDAAPGGAPPPEGSAPGGEAPPSMDQLVQAYTSLSPDELQLHAQALAQVMQSKQAPAAAGGAAPAASPAPAAAAPLAGEGSQLAGPEAQAAMKSEIASLKEQFASLKKHSEQLAGIVTKVVKPIVVSPGKAVTGDNVLVKTEVPNKPLTKTEVTQKLNEKAKDPNLAKSDRDLIRKYYQGVGKLDSLSHLLK